MPHMKGTSPTVATPAAGVVLDLARSAADEGEARAWADDSAFLAWAEGGGGASVIAAELKVETFLLNQTRGGLLSSSSGNAEVQGGSPAVLCLVSLEGRAMVMLDSFSASGLACQTLEEDTS